jgi:hypothetical protein
MADIFSGNGSDGHRSSRWLIEDLLQAIPKSRTNDFVYFNPAERERVVGLNVLESVDRSQRSFVVSSLIGIQRNLYPNNWGPRTEYILDLMGGQLLWNGCGGWI